MAVTIKKLNVKINADNSKLKSGLKQSQASVNSFSKSLKRMGGILAGAFSVTKVAGLFKETVRLYGIQEQAEKKLADSIAATGGNVASLLPKYKNLASAIQEVTTVGDEVTIGLIALGKQMGISDSAMERATRGAIGLSKAFLVDLNTAMKMVAAGIQGDTTLLNRYIPQLRFATTQAEKMAIMNKAMANGWKVATGEAETFTGRMDQLGNTIGDIKEGIGGAIAETMTEPLKNLSTWVKENQQEIVGFFKNAIKSGENIAKGMIDVIKVVSQAFGIIGDVAKFFYKNFLLVRGVVDGVRTAMALLTDEWGKTEMKAMAGIKNLAATEKIVIDKYRDMLSTLNISTEMRKKFTKDFKHIGDIGIRYNKIMQAISKGKYGEKLGEDFKKWLKGLRSSAKTLDKLHPKVTKIARDYTIFNNVLKEASEKFVSNSEEILKGTISYDKLTYAVDQGVIAGKDFTAVNSKMATGFEKSKKSVKETTDTIIELINTFSELSSSVTSFLSKLGLFSDDTASMLDDILGDTSSILTKALSGDILGAAIEGLTFQINMISGWVDKYNELILGKTIKAQTSWMNLTEEQTDSLKELAEEISDVHAAISIMLDEFIEANATIENFNNFARQTRDILSDLDRKTLSEKDVIKELGEAFAALTEKMEGFGMTASKDVIAILDDVRNRGLHVQEIIEFIARNLSKATSGLEKFAKVGITTQEEFNAVMNITLAQFDEMVRNGEGIVSAILSLDGVFDSLQEQMKKVGFEGSAAFDSLLQFRGLVKQNQELVEGIDGLNSALEGMAAIGLVRTQDAFDDFQTLALSNFDKLIQAGFNETQSLIQMAPFLANLVKLQQEFGFEIDAATQALIDQAKEKGLLDGMLSPMEQMVELMKALVEGFGFDLPDAFKKAGTAAGALAKDLDRIGDKIPDNIDIGINVPNLPAPTKPAPGFASGANFVVPSGYERDNFPMFVSTGEHVQVTPAGQTPSTMMNFEINISAGSGTNGRDLAREFIQELRLNKRGIQKEIRAIT